MPVDIIMYHYVRNNEDHFFDTYSRRKIEFESQIDFFKKNKPILDPKDQDSIIYYLKKESESAFLLTFDDGYLDHFYCAEYLESKNVKGYFFIPINSIEGDLLDVNAIHVLIGSRKHSKEKILNEIFKICQENQFHFQINKDKLSLKEYIKAFEIDARFDSKKELLLKRILQRDLIGISNRKFIIEQLLKKFMSKNIPIQKQIYLEIKKLLLMKKMGMSFGSHGNTHSWLNRLSEEEQFKELKNSFDKLKKLELVSKTDPKALCFPYGAYNKQTLKIMKILKIDIGLTSKPGSAKYNYEKNSIFELSRWDTNDWWDNQLKKPCKPY